jgi:hypothetical protein
VTAPPNAPRAVPPLTRIRWSKRRPPSPATLAALEAMARMAFEQWTREGRKAS